MANGARGSSGDVEKLIKGGFGRWSTCYKCVNNRKSATAASPGDLTQTKKPVASLQCAEATGKRAWLLDNGRGPIEQANRVGGQILLQSP
jgi:hypothetical protein